MRTLIVMVCLGAILAVGAAPATAAEKALWGPATLPDGRSAFPTYAQLGVDTLQFTLDWSAIAPTRPTDPRNPADPSYRWPAEVDLAAREAPKQDIRLALLTIFAPPWANGGQDRRWVPTDPSDYADFLVAASRRYSGVRRWMIWSEPNKAMNFQPNENGKGTSAKAYAPLLDAAYGALKHANVGNKVIGGMTWSGGEVRPRLFLEHLRLADGRRPRLDWYGHNPFPFRFPDLAKAPQSGYRDFSDLDTYQREVRSAFGRTVPFWLSEYTIQSDQGSRTFPTFVSRANQARWLTTGYRIADTQITTAGLGWLALIDQPPGPGNEFFGLLTSDLQEKPAYAAFRAAPSERFAPGLSAPTRVRAQALAGRGFAIRVRPRRHGRITVRLRRGSTVVARASTDGRGRPATVRLRRATPPRPGQYHLVVTSPRGSTVTRTLRLG